MVKKHEVNIKVIPFYFIINNIYIGYYNIVKVVAVVYIEYYNCCYHLF